MREDARVEDYHVPGLVFHPVLYAPTADKEMSAGELAEWCHDDEPVLVVCVVCMQQYPKVLKQRHPEKGHLGAKLYVRHALEDPA